MAYSRWIGSEWYIYWTTDSGDTKETQLLEVWLAQGNSRAFSYEELTSPDFKIETYFPSAKDFTDAKESIAEFIEDVNESFSQQEEQ